MRRATEMRDELILETKCVDNVMRQPMPMPPSIVNLQQQILVRTNYHNSQPPMENTQVESNQIGVSCMHECLRGFG